MTLRGLTQSPGLEGGVLGVGVGVDGQWGKSGCADEVGGCGVAEAWRNGAGL